MSQECHIKVGILDSDITYCSLLKPILDSVAALEPVPIHASVAQAAAQWGREGPDVLLVDVAMSEDSPGQFVRTFLTKWPHTHLIVLTHLLDPSSVLSCFQAGASGYLSKTTPLPRVCEAIEEVWDGGCPISPQAGSCLADWFYTSSTPAVEDVVLSSRERKILDMLSLRWRNRQIASELGLAETTVRAHLRRIYKKLHVHSRAQAVARNELKRFK